MSDSISIFSSHFISLLSLRALWKESKLRIFWLRHPAASNEVNKARTFSHHSLLRKIALFGCFDSPSSHNTWAIEFQIEWNQISVIFLCNIQSTLTFLFYWLFALLLFAAFQRKASKRHDCFGNIFLFRHFSHKHDMWKLSFASFAYKLFLSYRIVIIFFVFLTLSLASMHYMISTLSWRMWWKKFNMFNNECNM